MSKQPQVFKRHLKSNNHLLKKKFVVFESKQITKKNSSNIWAKICGGGNTSINKLRIPIVRESIKLIDPNIPSVNTVIKLLFD